MAYLFYNSMNHMITFTLSLSLKSGGKRFSFTPEVHKSMPTMSF